MELKTFSDYQKKALETNTYPEDKGLLLVAIGLGEEFGELIGKLDKYRDLDDVKNVNRNEGRVFEIEEEKEKLIIEVKKELGDVFWYLSMNFYYLNDEIDFLLENYEHAKKINGSVFQYLFQKTYLSYLGNIKKRFRDDLLNDKQCFDKLLKLLRFLCFYCQAIDFDIKEILELNIEKLADRKKRGKIQGNGDNR